MVRVSDRARGASRGADLCMSTGTVKGTLRVKVRVRVTNTITVRV